MAAKRKRKKGSKKGHKRRTTPKWSPAKRASFKKAKRKLINDFNRS